MCARVPRRTRNLGQKTAAQWERTEGRAFRFTPERLTSQRMYDKRAGILIRLESLIFESRGLSKE